MRRPRQLPRWLLPAAMALVLAAVASAEAQQRPGGFLGGGEHGDFRRGAPDRYPDRNAGGYRDNHPGRFSEHDWGVWRGGAWRHDWHNGRFGWWWLVGPDWYFYPEPVYPYPNPYVPPVVAPSPPATGEGPPPAQYWYYCDNPAGYYPYVATCLTQWRPVPAAPQGPSQ